MHPVQRGALSQGEWEPLFGSVPDASEIRDQYLLHLYLPLVTRYSSLVTLFIRPAETQTSKAGDVVFQED
jgi:hypothetical protein